jgi:hypothetical protein
VCLGCLTASLLSALAGEPPTPEAITHYTKGVQQKQANRPEQAVDELKTAVTLSPDFLEAHWVLGWTYSSLKQKDQAVAEFNEVIRIDPKGQRATEARQAIERLGGKLKEPPPDPAPPQKPKEPDKPAPATEPAQPADQPSPPAQNGSVMIGDFETDARAWQGLVRDETIAHGGKASGKWNLADPKAPLVQCRAIPHDWTSYDELRCWAYSPKATGAQAKVILLSVREGGDPIASYCFVFPINWMGWRELVFPKWRFRTWAKPVGWEKIDAVLFVGRGWGLPDPPAETVLHLDDVVVRRIPPDQERMTIEDLEGNTDDWSYMKVTQAQVHGGSWAAIMTDFAQHPFATSFWVPHDWSTWDALELWIYSEKANGAPLKILVDSDNTETEETDYYLAIMSVTWTGWRQVLLPKWALTPYLKPRGWDQIRGLTIAGAQWGLAEPKPDTVLYVDDIGLVRLGKQAQLAVEDFESGVKHWKGLAETTELFKSGAHGGLWANLEKNPYVYTTRVPRDWHHFNALRFWAYSRKANGQAVRVLVQSAPRPGTEWQNCFTIDFKVDWEGWKQLTFPQADFQAYGAPAGWQTVDGLILRGGEGGLIALPDTELVLDDLELVRLGGAEGKE